MEKVMISIVILGSISGLTKGLGVLPDGPLNATVDGTFLFTTSLPPTETPFVAVGWSFNENNIIVSQAVSNTTPPEYVDRITLFPSTGSLELRSLTEADSGEYSVTIIPATGDALEGSTTLNIYVPVSNVAINPKSADVVEFSSVSLSCSATGSSISFLWLNDTSEVTANDRVHLTDEGSTLTIDNVTRYDQQPFRCRVFNPVSSSTSNPVNITINLPVSNVSVLPKSADVVEFSSVSLSCTATGSSISFLWLNDTSEVTSSDRVNLTDGGSTLTIVNVSRYDQQPFRCHVFNPVSNDTSDPVNIIVSFGPENTNLLVSPSGEYFAEGSDIRLSCSTASRPPAHFLWFLNGERLLHTEPELILTNIQMNNTGSYICQAFNNKTMRNDISEPIAISVLESVSNVAVLPKSADVVEFSSVSLSCSATGSSISFLWLNDTSEVTASDRVHLTDGGSNLTVNVSRYDQQPFKCRVLNPVSTDVSDPVNIIVSFGPENTKLLLTPSQEYFSKGSDVRLSCSTESRPPAQFLWFLNGESLLHTESELILTNVQMNNAGNYSCQAFNNKTMRNETSQLAAISILDESSVCPAGCIAGIVIACCVVIAGAVGGGFFIYVKKTKKKPQTPVTPVTPVTEHRHIYENTIEMYENAKETQ